MAENEEYRRAVNGFYRVYEPAREKYNLRMESSFGARNDGRIEIWRYEGERRVEKVCRVSMQDVDIAVYYKRAMQEVEDYVKYMEGREDGGNTANYTGPVDGLERGYQREAS